MNDLERLARASAAFAWPSSFAEAYWKERVPEIRIILATMRDPSDDVVDAVVLAMGPSKRTWDVLNERSKDVWRTCARETIDAFLDAMGVGDGVALEDESQCSQVRNEPEGVNEKGKQG